RNADRGRGPGGGQCHLPGDGRPSPRAADGAEGLQGAGVAGPAIAGGGYELRRPLSLALASSTAFFMGPGASRSRGLHAAPHAGTVVGWSFSSPVYPHHAESAVRHLVFLLAPLLLTGALVPPTRAQEEARAILDKAIKAHGGEDKLAKLNITRIKAKGKVN